MLSLYLTLVLVNSDAVENHDKIARPLANNDVLHKSVVYDESSVQGK
jgi:hypothetical protein